MASIATCERCGAPIIWVAYRGSLNMAPVDADPAPNGTIAIDMATRTYEIVPAQFRTGVLHTSHLVTCPFTDEVPAVRFHTATPKRITTKGARYE